MRTLRLVRLRALLTIVAALGAVLLAGGCDTGLQNSGESHFGNTRAFLRVCEDGTCENGDACECAVCTYPCAGKADCLERILGKDYDKSAIPPGIQCQSPSCGDSSEVTPGDDGVCDVWCENDSDCAFLDEKHDGNPHRCRGGSCRTTEDPDVESNEGVPEVICPDQRILVPGAIAPEGVGYCLDRTEVTVEAFTACVDTGACQPPTAGNFFTSGRELHPVQFITLTQAMDFCESKNARLPTRDEWFAAAAGQAESVYPWGDEVPSLTDNPQRVCAFSPTTCEVDSYFAGASPLGHVDLSGNVSELVVTDVESCAAGGSFDSTAAELSTMSCPAFDDVPTATVGFRCLNDL